MKRPLIFKLTAIFVCTGLLLTLSASAQLGIPLTIKKPQEYEERELRSERSDQKKFTLPRRFIQNTVTHYNYYFNANNKLNEILEKAKALFHDDYSLLLPFYNYQLDVTAQDSIQLDSITYKSSTGIALHDLRNDWVDNLYLLWGAAYYLQKEFDSAYLMFQFINYAFASKEKDGYMLTIGSKRDGNSALSIATKEKNSLPKKIFSEPPSRNDAFIWQIRNFLAQDQLAEAASLIVTLRNDPNFPKRLHNDLHEVQAYWFYKQRMWDSSATHLVKALDNATTKLEKARWEYLAAQLFELSGHYKEAVNYYAKVSAHTTDLIMDIYARLYSIRANKDDGEKDIAKNVAELLKMAKRDKYQDYQDIIYYMAAQMQLDGKNIDQALALLLKSTQYASNNPEQRNRAFLQLGDICFNRQDFRLAANFYDSIQLNDPSIKNPESITARKKTAATLADNLEIIARQDSLQRIASLPEAERKDFVKKLVKTLRKQQGLKEEAIQAGSSLPAFNAPVIPSLFASGQIKGEWYFYNNSSRTKGQADFKSKWGTRPNVDNWRRLAAVGRGNVATTGNTIPGDDKSQANNNTQGAEEITFDGLYDKLPLKAEDLEHSNDSIKQALFQLGKLYLQELEDCSSSTGRYEELRTRFPSFEPMDEVLFNLYYCYNKYGEAAKASACKKALNDRYPASKFTNIINTGKNPDVKSGKSDATTTYERIYDLFIEGKFSEAVAEKKTADKVYGQNYWTPQLLYIEAVYYIKQREDTTAKSILTNLIAQYATSPLASKATTLLNILNRRGEIEAELSSMVVKRNIGDTSSKAPVIQPVNVFTQPKTDSTAVKTQPVNNQPAVNPVNVNPVQIVPSPYADNPSVPHFVVLVMNKVDPVFTNEAKNAFTRYNRDTYYNKTFSADLFTLDADNRLLLMSPFSNAQEAIDYIDKAKPKTPTEILPWLKGGKYSFIILTASNYEILQNNKDVDKYRAFLNQHYPGKF